jgi:hypothetical protein
MKRIHGKEKFHDIPIEELSRKHEMWEYNPRCIKSVFNFHSKPSRDQRPFTSFGRGRIQEDMTAN